jgi:hypothetical protein
VVRDKIYPGLLGMLWQGSPQVVGPGDATGTFGSSLVVKLVNIFVLNFMCIQGNPLTDKIPEYLKTLGYLVSRGNLSIREQMEISKGFNYLASHHAEEILPVFPEIAQYMLRLSSSPEYEVRLHALDFWAAVAMGDILLDMAKSTEGLIGEVVRVLMENMVYSKADYEAMDEAVWAADDASVPDREEAVEPRFRTERGNHETGEPAMTEDEDDEEGGNLWGESWTARKAAARSLDALASALGGEILEKLLPLLEIAMASSNWQVSEAGVLALGAISAGECLEELAKKGLKVVVGQWLVQKFLTHEIPLVRSISLWTLGRLAGYIVFEGDMCAGVLASVLGRMDDKNKAVQQSAVTTVTSLVEAGGLAGNFSSEIARTMARCVLKYQTRNLVSLLDSAMNLIDATAHSEAAATATDDIKLLVNEVVCVFMATSETHKQLYIASAEYLCSVLGNMPENIQSVEQLARVLEKAMVAIKAKITNSREIDPDVLAVAIDLVASAVAANAPVTGGELVSVVVALTLRLQLTDPDFLKQSVMALLGDLFRKAIDKFNADTLYQIVPLALEICQSGNFQAANNAIWALGELANQRPLGNIFVRSLAEICVEICKLEKTRPLLRQNACITFGRLGKFAATELAACPAFKEGLELAGPVMAKLPIDGEKISAGLGIFSATLAKKAGGDLTTEEISPCAGRNQGRREDPHRQPETKRQLPERHGSDAHGRAL